MYLEQHTHSRSPTLLTIALKQTECQVVPLVFMLLLKDCQKQPQYYGVLLHVSVILWHKMCLVQIFELSACIVYW